MLPKTRLEEASTNEPRQVNHILEGVKTKVALDTAEMETLNATILEVIADASLFPPNEGYRFTPTDREPDKLHINPRDPIYDGVVCDILHPADGRIIAKKSPDAHESTNMSDMHLPIHFPVTYVCVIDQRFPIAAV